MKTILPIFSLAIGPAHAVTVDSVDALMNNLWKSMSSPAGKTADIKTLQSILHNRAVVVGTSAKKPDNVKFSDKEEFLQSMQKQREQGFYECELYRKTYVTEAFATVFSVVESRISPEIARGSHIGVNSLQMQYLDGKWQILSIHYYLVGLDIIESNLDMKIKRECINNI